MVTGLFVDLELDVASSAESIGAILANFPSSQIGKALKAEFSNAYYKFYSELWSGLDLIEGIESQLLKQHIVSRLHLDLNLLSIAIYRSFRRALYCRCFNGIDLSQMKQAGLYAYWLAKMRPIVVGTQADDLDDLPIGLERGLQEINERFAFYIISAFYQEEYHRGLSDVSEYQTHFVHALRYRSFTEDSMMLVTESLGVSADSSKAVF